MGLVGSVYIGCWYDERWWSRECPEQRRVEKYRCSWLAKEFLQCCVECDRSLQKGYEGTLAFVMILFPFAAHFFYWLMRSPIRVQSWTPTSWNQRKVRNSSNLITPSLFRSISSNSVSTPFRLNCEAILLNSRRTFS